mmetsp:Transcript_2945/g.6895  ORF Transcript_2945/g.6895 Transcript_2945/m.6895 type:complete len:300 (+) Transcript_2945:1269-2168(+)
MQFPGAVSCGPPRRLQALRQVLPGGEAAPAEGRRRQSAHEDGGPHPGPPHHLGHMRAAQPQGRGHAREDDPGLLARGGRHPTAPRGHCGLRRLPELPGGGALGRGRRRRGGALLRGGGPAGPRDRAHRPRADGEVQHPPRDQHREEVRWIPQHGLQGPHLLGHRGSAQGDRAVRPGQGLQVLDVRALVGPAGDHPQHLLGVPRRAAPGARLRQDRQGLPGRLLPPGRNWGRAEHQAAGGKGGHEAQDRGHVPEAGGGPGQHGVARADGQARPGSDAAAGDAEQRRRCRGHPLGLGPADA